MYTKITLAKILHLSFIDKYVQDDGKPKPYKLPYCQQITLADCKEY